MTARTHDDDFRGERREHLQITQREAEVRNATTDKAAVVHRTEEGTPRWEPCCAPGPIVVLHKVRTHGDPGGIAHRRQLAVVQLRHERGHPLAAGRPPAQRPPTCGGVPCWPVTSPPSG